MGDLNTRARITVATFGPLLLFVALGLGVVVHAFPRIIEGVVLQRQTALAQIAATGVVGEMGGHLRLLQSTADDVASLVGVSQSQDALAVKDLLARRVVLLQIFTGGVVYVDQAASGGTDGTVLAVGPGAEATAWHNFAYRDHYQSVVEGQSAVFSAVLRDEPTGRNAVVIAVPVRQRGQVMGVLFGEFDLRRNTWANNLNLLRTSQGGIAYLIDSATTIITHPQADQIGKTIQDQNPELWALVLEGEPQSRIYSRTDTGERVVTSFAPVPGIAWGVITEESWDAILSEARLSIYAITGLWIVGLLVAAVVLSTAVRRTLLPLDAIVAGAQAVVGGESFQPFAQAGAPDIRRLVDALNQMVAQLGTQQAALQDYARRVLRSQEDERKRISRDLHDETVQSLVGLNQRIELLRRALGDVASGNGSGNGLAVARTRLAEVEALAADTLAEVRRMSYDLRPFMLEDLGLSAALQALSDNLDTELPDVRVHFEIVGYERRLSPEVELTVFRIVQESLSNVRKHVAPVVTGVVEDVPPPNYRVSVALIYEDWGILVLVEDNGPGMDLPPTEELVRAGHLGIAGMVERAQLFGGTLDVTSTPGEGMTVRLRIEA